MYEQSRNGVVLERYDFIQSNGGTPSEARSRTTYGWYDFRSGESMPHWKARIALAVSATTDFSARSTTVEHKPGFCEVKAKVTGVPSQTRVYRRDGCMYLQDFSGHTSLGESSSAAENTAASKFYSEYSRAIKLLEGGELLGETGKTAKAIASKLRAFTSPLQTWKKIMSGIKPTRGNRANAARRAIAGASDAYLEWKFGIDPLAQDIKALATGFEGDYFEVIPIEATGKGSSSGHLDGEYADTIGAVQYKAHVVSTSSSSVRYKAGVKVARYGAYGFTERLGLSPRNFLPTLYNLLPWTYMIDYVTNIGDIVSAISFSSPNVSWCNRTIRTNLNIRVIAGTSVDIMPGFTMDTGYPISKPSVTTWNTKTINRTDAMPPRLPSLSFRMPSFQTEGGRMKWLNVAAILASKSWGNSWSASMGGLSE